MGGVTQKIEGFFDACRVVGLSGSQGVMLPRRNVDNLVLRSDVRDAVEAERFHLWAIDRVEEGWEVVAGRPAGRAGDDGSFPAGTVHHDVARQLARGREGWKETRPEPGPEVQVVAPEESREPPDRFPEVPAPDVPGPEAPASDAEEPEPPGSG